MQFGSHWLIITFVDECVGSNLVNLGSIINSSQNDIQQSFLCQFQLYIRRIEIQLMKHIELSRLFIYSGIKVSREIPKRYIHSFNVCRYSCKEVYDYGGLVEKIVSFFDLVR